MTRMLLQTTPEEFLTEITFHQSCDQDRNIRKIHFFPLRGTEEDIEWYAHKHS